MDMLIVSLDLPLAIAEYLPYCRDCCVSRPLTEKALKITIYVIDYGIDYVNDYTGFTQVESRRGSEAGSERARASKSESEHASMEADPEGRYSLIATGKTGYGLTEVGSACHATCV